MTTATTRTVRPTLTALEPREVPAAFTPRPPDGLLPTRADGIALASSGVVPPASVIRLAPTPRFFPGGGPSPQSYSSNRPSTTSFFDGFAPAQPANPFGVSRPGDLLRPAGLPVAPPPDAAPTVVVLPAVYVG